jgi:hypothetical protein
MHLQRPAYRGIVITSALLSLFGALGLGVWSFSSQIPSLNKNGVEHIYTQAYLPYILVASILMVMAGITAWRFARSNQHRAIWVLAWAGFLSGQILMLGHEPWGRYIAGTEHLAAVQAELTPDMPLYAVGQYEQALPFYLRHTTILVKHPDEMEFGLQQEPQLWIPKLEDFVDKWRAFQASGVTAMAIINPEIYADFVQQGLPMRIISQDPRRVIVSSKLTPTTAIK